MSDVLREAQQALAREEERLRRTDERVLVMDDDRDRMKSSITTQEVFVTRGETPVGQLVFSGTTSIQDCTL